MSGEGKELRDAILLIVRAWDADQLRLLTGAQYPATFQQVADAMELCRRHTAGVVPDMHVPPFGVGTRGA